jgi:hypothetical protein
METTLKNKIFVLSQDNKEIFQGTENECYIKLQKIQSFSADWAMKYEGYKIESLTNKK